MGNGSGYSSNIITGFIGAVIGSLVGVGIWVGIYQLGYIAAIAGFVIIIGAMRGYEILGRAMDLKGAVIAAIVALAMVFVANYLSWSLEVYLEFKEFGGITFVSVLKAMPDLIKEFDLQGDFAKDLAMGYVLTIVGGASTLARMFKGAR